MDKLDFRGRASALQFATLLQFMESYGDLAKPQSGALGRVRAEHLWQELTDMLNSIGGGVNKNGEKWKKVWADWKYKTKQKALLIREHARRTVGGPSNRLALTPMEKRLLGVIGTLAAEGNSAIEEAGFNKPSSHIAVTVQVENENDILFEDGIIQSPTGPSTSHVDTDPLCLTPPQAVTQPAPPATPHSPSRCPPNTTARSSISPTRRRHLGTRRLRRLTPFDRAASEFADIEQRRLQLEEKRERNEARRIDVEDERNGILKRFADIAEALLQQYIISGSSQ